MKSLFPGVGKGFCCVPGLFYTSCRSVIHEDTREDLDDTRDLPNDTREDKSKLARV